MEVGNKILGFEVQNTAMTSFTAEMRDLVSKVGVIDAIDEALGVIRIYFGNGEAWWYPAAEAINHIVADDYVESTPEEDLYLLNISYLYHICLCFWYL